MMDSIFWGLTFVFHGINCCVAHLYFITLLGFCLSVDLTTELHRKKALCVLQSFHFVTR